MLKDFVNWVLFILDMGVRSLFISRSNKSFEKVQLKKQKSLSRKAVGKISDPRDSISPREKGGLVFRKGKMSDPFREESLFQHAQLWNRLSSLISEVECEFPCEGCIHCSINLNPPFIAVSETTTLAYFFFGLLEGYAFRLRNRFAKMTVGYKVEFAQGRGQVVTSTLGGAIPLFTASGKPLSRGSIYSGIERRVQEFAEVYGAASVQGLFINIYYVSDLNSESDLDIDLFEKSPFTNEAISKSIFDTRNRKDKIA